MVILRRGATPLLHHLLDTTKVVVLEGGRAVGKTTLVLQVAEERGFGTSFDLSDPADRSALAGDPHRVLAASSRPILIDEAQLEPEVTVAVKRLVDTSAQPGQVLLTGSARIGRGALGGGDPLAGRAVRMRLQSFTQGELAGEPSGALDRWWAGDPESSVYSELQLGDLTRRLIAGGLPPVSLSAPDAAQPSQPDIHRVLSAYVDGVLTANLAGTRTDRARLLQTFRYLAANPGQILNLSRAASEMSMRVETVQAHIDLCEAGFLLDTAPAHRPSEHQTLTAHPRVFASDVGLAAWAADMSTTRLLRNPKLLGGLVENLVATELTAQAAWSTTRTRTFHWRNSRTGREVDLVLRRPDGSMLAIEVKSAGAVSMADAKGLVAFAVASEGQLVRSFIVYTGRATIQLAEDVWAVPLSSLFGQNA